MNETMPKTKEECFAQLDAMLSEEEKNELKNSEDFFDYHFTLGMWIRNNWIYRLSNEEMKTFIKMFVDESPYGFFFIHPDNVSSIIIEKYVEYLRDKK